MAALAGFIFKFITLIYIIESVSASCSTELETKLKAYNCTCDSENETGTFARCIGTNLLTVPTGLPTTTSLQGLHVEESSMECIGKIPYSSLEFVILSNNDIACIPPGIFSNLGKLDTMVLANNSFHLKPNTFEGMVSLKTLNLDNNPLYELVNMTFSGNATPALDHLSLANCRIYEVQSLAFHNSQKLQVLNLSHNRLTRPVQIDNALSLNTLDLSANEINDLNNLLSYGLQKVVTLHLDHNRLTELSAWSFKGLDNLKSITVSFNQLVEVSPLTFSTLVHLETIRLDHNQLKSLKITASQVNSLESLKLHHNRWKCNCTIGWMRENEMIREYNPPDIMECKSPKEVSGQNLYEVDIHQFDCPDPHHGLHSTTVALAVGIIVSLLLVVAVAFLGYQYVVNKKKPDGKKVSYSEVDMNNSREPLDL